jgi:hypothetical protein
MNFHSAWLGLVDCVQRDLATVLEKFVALLALLGLGIVNFVLLNSGEYFGQLEPNFFEGGFERRASNQTGSLFNCREENSPLLALLLH